MSAADSRPLFPPGSRPICLRKSQGEWKVFLKEDLMRSPWFDSWVEARDFAFKEAERLRGQIVIWLTAAASEPPPGTTVEDSLSRVWERDSDDMLPAAWNRVDADDDPETWTKIAGNYGPVRIVRRVP